MEIEEILKASEGKRLEFKERLPSGDHIVKTVTAFSNIAGGEIYIGIEDSTKKVVGVPEDEVFKLEEKLVNSIYDNIRPKVTPDISVINYKGKYLVRIIVYPGSQPPYFMTSKGKDKNAYIRIGSVNRIADEEQMLELERKKRNISFDSAPVFNLTPEEVDLSSFIKEYELVTNETVDKTTLLKLGLLKEERGETIPTYAAVLLAGNSIKNVMFPYATVECTAFKGEGLATTLDSRTIDSPLIHQPSEVMAFVERNIRLTSKLSGLYREDRWEYPLNAIRELIVNAIIHRDYSLSGRYIKVTISELKIEILSPGYLPGTLAPELLGSGISELRNKTLAPIFKRLNLIEQWGTGFRKVKDELKKYPELSLEVSEIGASLSVTIKKKAAGVATPPDIPEDDDLDSGILMVREPTPVFETRRKSPPKDPLLIEIFSLCRTPISLLELMEKTGKKDRTKFRDKYINPYLNIYLMMTLPDKPKSPHQKYFLSEEGYGALREMLTFSQI